MNAKQLILSLPEKFDSSGMENENAKFHFDIAGDEGGIYTVDIVDGVCSVKEGKDGDPDCTIKSKAEVLNKIINKDLNAQMALFTGKLKISNLGIMMKFAKRFGLM